MSRESEIVWNELTMILEHANTLYFKIFQFNNQNEWKINKHIY